MMARDDRFYAFIVDRTSRSRARIRRICVHKHWLRAGAGLIVVLLGTAVYGLYGLTQHAVHLRIERENERLRAENRKQKEELNKLNNRVEAVEDTSRRLAEQSGVNNDGKTDLRGSGGPAFSLDSVMALEYKTDDLERRLQIYEAALRERAVTPSGWPVQGNFTDGFGGRRNPFGGSSTEFHTGQDIAAPWGTAASATANGTVTFAGWQAGYGQVVVIDHGGGLTTRFGHLSQILVPVGQSVKRGDIVGHVGSTGRSTGPHLHYEIRINDEPVDPTPYLPIKPPETQGGSQ
jgi:murein DD-endopeptidase MepM/ murein hydrolase activator NlpD